MERRKKKKGQKVEKAIEKKLLLIFELVSLLLAYVETLRVILKQNFLNKYFSRCVSFKSSLVILIAPCVHDHDDKIFKKNWIVLIEYKNNLQTLQLNS